METLNKFLYFKLIFFIITKISGFETAADYWLFDYESKSFENDVERISKQLQPLYQQLHAYTRRKLREV